MVFSSLLFVFAFLASQLLIYFLVRNTKARNIVLLVFSLIFYAWGGPKYLFLLLGECFISFFTAREIGRSRFQKMKKRWLRLDLILMFGLLLFFKYTGFIFTNIKLLTGWPEEIPSIVLPIGISFYTFQLVSYVADVYRGDVKAQEKYWKVLLYAGLFHQCIAGPIVRYSTVAEEIEERHASLKDVCYGIRRFSIGLAKKAILANGCASIADQILSADQAGLSGVSTGSMWLGMFAYMLQIYLDFSAYSDMAIGMGRMVGFHYLENFDYPYSAHSVQNFWRKWHISLSTFFRDYVYIPLGGNRKGIARTIFNMFIVWALTGMWHGASWNYILWGLYYFVFLTAERLFLGKLLDKNAVTRGLGHIYTLLVVFFGWVLFKFTDNASLLEVFRGLFGVNHALTSPETLSILVNNFVFLLVAVLSVFPLGKLIRAELNEKSRRRGNSGLADCLRFFDAVYPLVLLVLSVLALVGNSYNPFLYFQF